MNAFLLRAYISSKITRFIMVEVAVKHTEDGEAL